MAASLENPIYTVYLVDGNNKYNLSPAVVEIQSTNQDQQVAQSVQITMANIKATSDKTIAGLIKVRQRIFVHANDGKQNGEVFRGFVWTRYPEASLDSNTVTIKCYDNLIYMQESEDSFYFSKGKKTSSVMKSICSRWGIPLNYSYSSITHGKLVLRGNLTNIFMSDVLDLVKKRTGTKYVILSQKDTMYIMPVGSNTTVYQVTKKNNAVTTRAEETMDGMTTKVKILGQAKKNSQKQPVVATVKGDTAKYGTLQKLQDKDKDTSLAAAKKEANYEIKQNGKPHKEYQVEAVDIPWIKKGDKVLVNAGSISNKTLIAVGIERNITNAKKTMTLTLRDK